MPVLTPRQPLHSPLTSQHVWPWQGAHARRSRFADIAGREGTSTTLASAYLTLSQGLGKGGAKRHRKMCVFAFTRSRADSAQLARQHPGPPTLSPIAADRAGHHQACDPSSGSPRRCQAYLGPHLRGDARRAQDVRRSSSSPSADLAASSRTSSATRSPTPSTPSARPSPRSTSSTRSSARAAPSTASARDRPALSVLRPSRCPLVHLLNCVPRTSLDAPCLCRAAG